LFDSKEMLNLPRSKSQEIFRLSQISPKINDSSEGETTSSRAEYRKTKGRIDDPSFSSSEDKSGKKIISNSSEEKGLKKKRRKVLPTTKLKSRQRKMDLKKCLEKIRVLKKKYENIAQRIDRREKIYTIQNMENI